MCRVLSCLRAPVMKKKTFTLKTLLLFAAVFISSLLFAQSDTLPSLMEDLFSGDTLKSQKSLIIIKKGKPAAALPFIRNILISHNNEKFHATAIQALQSYPVATNLSEWLEILDKTPSFYVKQRVIEILSASRDKRVIPPIAQHLANPFHIVRNAAIQALKTFNDDRIYPVILDMATSADPVFKIYSLEAMNHLYDRRLYDLLVRLLSDENHSVRYQALKCIEKNALSKALNNVKRTALHDGNSEVRVRAIQIVGKSRSNNPYNILYNSLSAQHPDVRHAAVTALSDLDFSQTSRKLSDMLLTEKEDRVKEQIIDALIRFRKGADFRGLSHILFNEKNQSLRIRSAYAMGEIQDRDAVVHLIRVLTDPEIKVKAEACHALGHFKTRQSIDALLEVSEKEKERYVRTAALYSLKTIRDRKSLLPLFDQYTVETEPVYRELLKQVIRYLINESR